MNYTLKPKLPFTLAVSEIALYEGNEMKFKIIPIGIFPKRLFYPDYLMTDHNGNEVLKTKTKHLFSKNRHTIKKNEANIGYFEQKNISSFSISIKGYETCNINLSGFSGSKKWELTNSLNSIAKVSPDLPNWGWNIELLESENQEITLLGLALAYQCIQDTG